MIILEPTGIARGGRAEASGIAPRGTMREPAWVKDLTASYWR